MPKVKDGKVSINLKVTEEMYNHWIDKACEVICREGYRLAPGGGGGVRHPPVPKLCRNPKGTNDP